MRFEVAIPAGFKQVTEGKVQAGDYIKDKFAMRWASVTGGTKHGVYVGDDVDDIGEFYCVIRRVKESNA